MFPVERGFWAVHAPAKADSPFFYDMQVHNPADKQTDRKCTEHNFMNDRQTIECVKPEICTIQGYLDIMLMLMTAL